MTRDQRKFWEEVRDFARSWRCGRRVTLAVAADALALEQHVEQRLAGADVAERLVAEQAAPQPQEAGR